jgi:hypothetical protein
MITNTGALRVNTAAGLHLYVHSIDRSHGFAFLGQDPLGFLLQSCACGRVLMVGSTSKLDRFYKVGD